MSALRAQAKDKCKNASLHAFVAHDAKARTVLYRHKYRNNGYVVSMTRFGKDYIKVASYSDLLDRLKKGYSLRISSKEDGVTSPRMIKLGKIYRPVVM